MGRAGDVGSRFLGYARNDMSNTDMSNIMWGVGTGCCRGRNSWLPRRVGFVFSIVHWVGAPGRKPWPRFPPLREVVGIAGLCGLPCWLAYRLHHFSFARPVCRTRPTLNWLLTPMGMVAVPSLWPSPAAGVDHPPVNLSNSSSVRKGQRFGGGWDCRFPLLRLGKYGALGRFPGIGAGPLKPIKAGGVHSAL